jgi:hypothetical protein
MALMSLLAVAVLGSTIFPKDKDSIKCDERDQIIYQRASLAAFGASYLVMGLACMIPFFVLGYKAQISVHWLPDIFIAGCITEFIVHSAAILIQYGSDTHQEANA